MELLATLLGLYALQCALLVPRGGVLVLRLLGSWSLHEGPAWRVGHPLPSAPTWIGLRPPLVEDATGLRSRGLTPWLGAGVAPSPGPHLKLASGQAVAARGAVVRVDGRPFLRATSKRHAAELAALCEALATTGEGARPRLERALAESLSVAGVRADHQALQSATRWLRPLSDASFFALFIALPGFVGWLQVERALLFFAPAYAALHVATWVALVLAHRRLFPDASGERFELGMGCALYPPLLLRAVQDLRAVVLGHYHPAALATVLLPRERAIDFLRGELASAQYARQDEHADDPRSLAAREQALVAGLAGELDTTPDSMMAPPSRREARARSYCPVCLEEYRLESGQCADCRAALQRFAE